MTATGDADSRVVVAVAATAEEAEFARAILEANEIGCACEPVGEQDGGAWHVLVSQEASVAARRRLRAVPDL